MCLRCSGKSREVSNRGRAETVKEACREEQRRTGSGARWAWDGAAVPAQGSRANAEGLPLLPFLRAAMASRAGRPASLPPSLSPCFSPCPLSPSLSLLPACLSPPPLRPALSYPSHSYLPAALPGAGDQKQTTVECEPPERARQAYSRRVRALFACILLHKAY